MWLIILAELSVFAILFLVFSVQKALNPELFEQGQALLETSAGVWITIALLSASYFVAQAVEFFEQKQALTFLFWNSLACLAALTYIVIKCAEYSRLIELGYGLSGHQYFSYYFLITGFHLLHVVLGLGILLLLGLKRNSLSVHGVKTAASYWHMVDLVWLLLFPILYLL